jgi:hypothetical protein
MQARSSNDFDKAFEAALKMARAIDDKLGRVW